MCTAVVSARGHSVRGSPPHLAQLQHGLLRCLPVIPHRRTATLPSAAPVCGAPALLGAVLLCDARVRRGPKQSPFPLPVVCMLIHAPLLHPRLHRVSRQRSAESHAPAWSTAALTTYPPSLARRAGRRRSRLSAWGRSPASSRYFSGSRSEVGRAAFPSHAAQLHRQHIRRALPGGLVATAAWPPPGSFRSWLSFLGYRPPLGEPPACASFSATCGDLVRQRLERRRLVFRPCVQCDLIHICNRPSTRWHGRPSFGF